MRVLVLGAGFGGLELTTRLSEALGDDADVVLIDQADGFVFGFSKLDVMFGRTIPEAVHHRYADIVKPGVRFVQATIESIDPVAKRVETDAGAFEADVLVVALGADLHPEATPGLVEGGHEFYTVAGAFALRDVLAELRGRPRDRRRDARRRSSARRRPARPRCWCTTSSRRRGLRDRSEIALVMPLPVPIPPSPVASSQALLAAFEERGIEWHPSDWCARSTPTARSRSSPTTARCPTTCSSACRCTACPRWWRRRA